ncbi:hypothetical protein NH8B_1951 [Pseudogulbenkiania sp. NH8B]|uniref:hypothetical protein n=1 Tax=Pseudogulbenkiania sp. (strain NH8B) TaxID=748280 RepID=UPI0002279FEC|nr:hypothetical protein [Pseudogulbenkiania sp. NH8B]BAK76766.1 hypothetical protein NH8B_1951 [Pseudogulbenkiania sp. NH8B]
MTDASCSVSWMEWFKTLAPLGSWGLVVLGWMIVRGDNNRRERRKELRVIVDSVIEHLDALEQKTHDYFTSEPSTATDRVAQEIKSLLKVIACDLSSLKTEEPLLDCNLQIIRLRRRITSGEFDSASRVARTSNDPFFAEVAGDVIATQDHLKTKFLQVKR